MERAIGRFALPAGIFRSAAATPLSGKSKTKAPNQFAMDDRAIPLAKSQFCRIIKP
jgi:hypothetical protein